jgi:hypothetical protein
MTHNLLRAAHTLDPAKPAVARGATLRRQITRPSTAGPATATSHPAPARALALGHQMDGDVQRSLRHRPGARTPDSRLRPTTAEQARPRTHRGKAGQTSGNAMPAQARCAPDHDQPIRPGRSTDSR